MSARRQPLTADEIVEKPLGKYRARASAPPVRRRGRRILSGSASCKWLWW